MLLTCLALTLVAPMQDLPDKATCIYSGIPVASAGSTVQMVTHNSSEVLTKTDWSMDSLTYLKNVSNNPANITVTIPVEGHDVDWGMTDHVRVSATLDNEPLQLTKTDQKITPPTDQKLLASGVRAESYWQGYKAQLNFIGRGAHSLKVHVSAPIGHAGLDGTQRVISYDISGGSSWSGAISQLNFSLRYTPAIVFQIFSTLPKDEWQTGPTGAFIKQLNTTPSADQKFIFSYYIGGFDKIGG